MDLLFVGFLLFWLWALYDVITVDQSRVRNLPKILWIGIVVVLFVIGALCWVFLGRPPREMSATQPQAPRRPRRHAVPEPETPRDAAQRVITDRRSAELDRMLEEWERERRDPGGSD